MNLCGLPVKLIALFPSKPFLACAFGQTLPHTAGRLFFLDFLTSYAKLFLLTSLMNSGMSITDSFLH
jgi:hypothetical protein